MSASLLRHHRRVLTDRAVAPEVSRARGYSSTADARWLRQEGFSIRVSKLGSGLVIPVFDVHGKQPFFQFRPDNPRTSRGRLCKYELPVGQQPVIDVPPGALGRLTDPAVPLWITEGPLKADAAVSAGLTCVGITGVWGWLYKRTVLPDWRSVRVDGRTVYLAFDSDITTKRGVAQAVTELGEWLRTRGADVGYLMLPPGRGGTKTGIDDWLARNGYGTGPLIDLISDEPPTPPKRETTAPAARKPEVPVPTDPAGLLDEVRDWLVSYVAFPSAHHAVAVTLWVVHTHLADRFDSTGRLVLLSPEPECGKTRILELAESACAGAELLNDVSPAYLFRRIGAGPVTLLVDEADAIWKRGKGDESAEAVRSIINAGHRKGATVGRVEMNDGAKLVRFPVYAPAALAAKGNPLPDTIMSRAVVIRMRRRAPDQEVKRYRERITRPEGAVLRDKLAAWAASVASKIGDPWPDLPAGVDDRPADVWEPLVAIADLAGGDWPQRARDACKVIVSGARDDAETTGTRLLADLRDVFGDEEALWTATILHKLCALDEAPWGNWDEWHAKPLDARGLAKLLRPYGITSCQVRKGEVNRQGYPRHSLLDAWTRYLPPVSPTSPTSPTPLASHVGDVGDVGGTPQRRQAEGVLPTGSAHGAEADHE